LDTSPNKLGEEFLKARAEDFSTYGHAAIEKVPSERPHDYLR
jgi:hypothetical protein